MLRPGLSLALGVSLGVDADVVACRGVENPEADAVGGDLLGDPFCRETSTALGPPSDCLIALGWFESIRADARSGSCVP